MPFLHPGFLLLLPLVPLFGWWWHRRRMTAVRVSDTRLFRQLPTGRARWVSWFSTLARCAILLSLILALAGPRLPDRETRLPTEGIAILFACDISGSMAESDFRWNEREQLARLSAAKKSFRLFVEGGSIEEGPSFAGRAGDQIGLVTFAAWPRTECPLTLNHTVLLSVAEKLSPKESGLDTGTNIGDAIAESLIRLKPVNDRKRIIILLSDGEHNAAGEGIDAPLKPRQAAQLAANLGIPIYTIDCGGEPKPDTPAEQREQRAEGQRSLKAVAEMTSGKSFRANDGAELQAVYAAIDALERTPIISYQYRRYHEFAPQLALFAFGLLIVLMIVEQLLWRRLP